MSAENLTEERGRTHGDWLKQAEMASGLKQRLRAGENWNRLSASQREALDMICVKMSRIVSGNPDDPDHWDDIEGYAFLGKR